MLSKEKISQIVELIQQKKALFTKFMEVSQKMLVSDIDTLVILDEQRTDLRNQIDELDITLKKVYENEADADYIYRVLKNQENKGEIPLEYGEIFDASQSLYSLIYQIKENEVQVLAHLNLAKEKLLKQIKENQQSGKVVGYLKSLDQKDIPEGSLLSEGSRNA